MGTKTFGDKETRKTIQYAVAHGFTVKRNGKHVKLTKDDQVVTVSTTSSCPYGMANAMRDIDKALNTLKGKTK